MRQQVVTVGPIASSSGNNIITSTTPGAAGDITLNGSTVSGGVATLDVPRQVAITSSGNVSSVKFTITGTNAFGNPIQETITGPNANTVGTISDFKTVTSVYISGAAGSAITVGTSSVASSPWMAIDYYIDPPCTTAFSVVATGTVNWTIEYVYQDLNSNIYGNNNPYPPVPAATYSQTGLTAQTGNADDAIAFPIAFWRATLNSGTGSIQATAIQAGLPN